MIDVFYLDYGQSECVSLDRICHSTPGDILSRRAMAQYATLEGVQSVSMRNCVKVCVKDSIVEGQIIMNINQLEYLSFRMV